MRTWTARFLVAAVFAAASACEGRSASPGATAGQGANAPESVPWLRGLSATDVREAVRPLGLTCDGPRREGGTNVWSCQSGTPLLGYRVQYYGAAPLRIEYVTGTVTQVENPKDDRAARLFVLLAGLHYNGCEPAKAREWVVKTIATGGDATFGPAKYRLRGDPQKRTLDIKAPGSEW